MAMNAAVKAKSSAYFSGSGIPAANSTPRTPAVTHTTMSISPEPTRNQ